jgi:hypothetical protein
MPPVAFGGKKGDAEADADHLASFGAGVSDTFRHGRAIALRGQHDPVHDPAGHDGQARRDADLALRRFLAGQRLRVAANDAAGACAMARISFVIEGIVRVRAALAQVQSVRSEQPHGVHRPVAEHRVLGEAGVQVPDPKIPPVDLLGRARQLRQQRARLAASHHPQIPVGAWCHASSLGRASAPSAAPVQPAASSGLGWLLDAHARARHRWRHEQRHAAITSCRA